MRPLPQDTRATSSGASVPLSVPVESMAPVLAEADADAAAVEVVVGNAALASPAWLQGDGNPECPRVAAVGVVVAAAVVGAMYDTAGRGPLIRSWPALDPARGNHR